MYTGILHTHTLVVTLFILIYLIKTFLLVLNRNESLQSFTRKVKIPEIIISTLFLLTGIYLAVKTGNKGEWLWVKIACIAVVIPLAIVAFKKANKGLALLSFVLLVYIYGISETKSPTFKNDTPIVTEPTPGTAISGKDIFDSQCANCHGSDGKMGLSGAKDLTASTLSHQEITEIITNGKNAMRSFKNDLSVEQIEAVATYVEELK